jgi:hypothetical protein
VDEICILTPFSVSVDDPNIRVTTSKSAGIHRFISSTDRDADQVLRFLQRYECVERAFDQSWLKRGSALTETSQPSSPTCQWLYYSVTVDAAHRLMPCCIAPTHSQRLVYGTLDDRQVSSSALLNIRDFVGSRLSFAQRPRFESEWAEKRPFCAICNKPPSLTHQPAAAVSDLLSLDFRRALAGLEPAAVQRLTNWH